MTHSFRAAPPRHPDPGRIHELARQRAAQLRREAQARWLDATARTAGHAVRAVWARLARWVARPLPAASRPAGAPQAHRPCA